MNISDVYTEVGTRLSAIPGLHVFDYEASAVSGETAFLGYPEEYNFDVALGNRSKDTMKLPVVVIVPNPKAKTTRERLMKYCDGSGTYSVKQALEVPATYTSFTALHVDSISFDSVFIGVGKAAVEYAGALFTLDIRGKGSV